MFNRSPQPGALIRTADDTVFFVPLEALMASFQLPEELQRGSVDGDALLNMLDRCPPVLGLKNAVFGSDLFEQDVEAGSPTAGKQKFVASAIAALSASEPTSGKQKFTQSTD